MLSSIFAKTLIKVIHYKYKLFGLTIESELELPELQSEFNKNPDVYIKLGSIPKHIQTEKKTEVIFRNSGDDFIFKLENIAKYRVQNGIKITIEPAAALIIESPKFAIEHMISCSDAPIFGLIMSITIAQVLAVSALHEKYNDPTNVIIK